VHYHVTFHVHELKETAQIPPYQHLRVWQPTCRQELYAYFGVLIHIGITIEPAIKAYWKDLNTHGSLIFLSTSTKFS
jgi:hypothetical protein